MENLSTLPAGIKIPSGDRDAIKVSIAHIGVSNFHRAHQVPYYQKLIECHGKQNYGICGIDLLETDRKIYHILKDQDGLYTLHTKDAEGGHTIEVINAVVEYFFAPENPLAVIERLAHPDIKIISLTIAEDGYHLKRTYWRI